MRSLLLFFIISILIVSCSGGESDFLSPEERAWLDSREGEISVLFGPDNPPESFINEMGVYTGMLVDYSRELQNILGYEFNRKIFSSWAGLIEYAERDENFIIVGIAPTERRSRFLRFTSKLVDVNYVLVGKSGADIESTADMVGKTYYAVGGYSIFDVKDQVLPGVTLIPVRDVIQGLEAVAKGEVDGFVDVSIYIDYNISRENIKGLEVFDVIGFDADYRIGVPLKDELLAGILDKALKQIPPSRHRELTRIWRDVEMKKVDPQLWKVLSALLGILVFLVGGVLLWVFSLRREVARKTEIILKDEQKRMEADRSESLKVLAGGISHDLNNLLTGLYAYTEMARNALKKGKDPEPFFCQVMKALNDSQSLSRQLLNFSKDGAGDGDKKIFPPSVYIREMVEFSMHGSHTSIDLDLPDGLWPIIADKGQIGQLVSNLVINAVQAMDGEGSLRVRGRNEMEAGLPVVALSIQDKGPGIPGDLQHKIFDPYFTTKEEGSGLGLASCRAIAADHGGSLTLNSVPGEGAEFILRIPAIQGKGVPE